MVLIAPDAPEVLPEKSPGIRVQPTAPESAFGGGPGLERLEQGEGQVNEQIQKIAGEGGAIAGFEKLRADQTAVWEAHNKLSKVAEDLIYNPETGLVAAHGKDAALQAHDRILKEFQEKANELSGTLNGQSQQGPFGKLAYETFNQVNHAALGHVAKESEEAYHNEYVALKENLTNTAAMAYGNPQTRATALSQLNEAIDAHAKGSGWGPEVAQAEKSKTLSNFHDQTIDRMLGDRKDLMAQQYYQENKDQITDSKIRDQIDAKLKSGSILGESQRQSDAIWQSTKGDLSKAFDQADKIDDPEIRKMTRERLREKQSDVDDARKASEDNAFFAVKDKIGKQQPKGLAELRDMAGTDWYKMSVAQQEATKKMYFNDQNSDAKWTEWNLMSPTEKAALNPAEFQTDYLSSFDAKHRDAAMKMYNEARGNKTLAISDHDQAKLIEANAQESGIVAGLHPGKPANKLRGDAAATYASFQDDVKESIADYERNELGGRRHASLQEAQKIIDQHVLSKVGEQSTGVFTVAGRLLGLSQTPPTRFQDIPDDAKEHLLLYARQLGKAVTKDQVEQAYASYQKKDRNGVRKAFQ